MENDNKRHKNKIFKDIPICYLCDWKEKVCCSILINNNLNTPFLKIVMYYKKFKVSEVFELLCPPQKFWYKITMKAILIFGGILILIPIVFLILLANGWIAF